MRTYIETPISEPPPTPRQDCPGYYTVLHSKYPDRMWQCYYRSRLDGSTFWYEDREATIAPTREFTHWLRPTETMEVDAGEFAKWCSINGWYYIINEGWSQDLREALCSPENTVFYPDEYVISLFRQKGGEG